jgi:SAM-dependent methyltransferase
LAQQGFEVTATDISDTVISLAKERSKNLKTKINFYVNNAIEDLPPGPFDLVFDRGLFHQFNYIEDRPKVVKNISDVLASEGTWVSVIGSTECCQNRELTPPRRSVIDIASAVEPYLRIEKIQASTEEMFTEKGLEYCSAWLLICKKRTVPARPWVPKSSQSV